MKAQIRGNEQMLAVMQRRSELLAKIDAQRKLVAQVGARWQAPLAVADQGLAVLRFMRSRPVLVACVAALLVWRRRGAVGVARMGWRAWKGYRYLAELAAKQ